MKKRILSLVLALAMTLALLPTATWAAKPMDSEAGGRTETVEVPPEAAEHPRVSPRTSQSADDGPEVDEGLQIEVSEPDEALYDAGYSVVLTLPGQWDSCDWQLWAGEAEGWTSLEVTDPTLPLSKEMFVCYAFRCVVTKDGVQTASAPYAYDEAALVAPTGTGVDLLWGEAPFKTHWKDSKYIAVADASNGGHCFDIYGIENGSDFKTTYTNGGYTIASQVDGTKVSWNAAPNTNVSMGGSLTGRFSFDVVYGGRYAKITYQVTNNGSTEKTFKVGSSGDVMIDQNDKAEVQGTTMGLQMDDGAGKLFNLVVPTATTKWFGYFGNAYASTFTGMSEQALNTPYNGDSGMAWSWTGTVKPGRTWTRYALIGVGEMPPPLPNPTINLQLDNGKNYVIPGETFTVSGTATGAGVVYIDVAGQEYEASVAANGSFSKQVTVPEDVTGDKLEIQAWAVNDATGAMSDTVSKTVTVRTPPTLALTAAETSVVEEESLSQSWYEGFVQSSHGTVTHTTVVTNTLGDKTVTYTASLEPFTPVTKTLTVHILPKPAELSQATTTQSGKSFTLKSAMKYTGGLTYTETGFVYGSFQNPSLDFYDGKVTSSPKANSKGAQFSATASGLTDNTVYYARAYAKASDGTVLYGPQSAPFGLGVPSYGTFKIKNNGNNTFTIYRDREQADGEQKVYYRTVNGSAVGKWNGDDYNFRHTDGVLTFADGEYEKTVTVKEFSNHAIYNGYVGTQYANANRTYQMEIHRVEGGATIGTRFATRDMGHDGGYEVRKSLYSSEHERSVSTSNDNNYVADRAHQQNGKDSGWEMPFFINERSKNQSHGCVNFNVQREIDVGNANENAYFKATASGFSYRLQLHSVENDNGYANIWISNHQPNSMWGTKDHGKSASIDLDYADFGHAFYTGRWEPGGHGNGEETVSYPSGSGATWPQSAKDSSRVSGDWVLFNPNETAQVWFTATGNKKNVWHATWYKDWLKLRDTQEPRVIDVSYMARDTDTCTYRPGDPITISLIFDEIVDRQNSSLTSSSSISVDGWGTFKYAGGADTNVLYFTGTTPDSPPTGGSNIKISLDCAGQIKDMCSTSGSESCIHPSGYSTTTAPVAEDPVPTVRVGSISNTNGTLSAKITATNADRLEYAWTNSSATPTSGWRRLNNKSGETVTTRQSSGSWYLHARATNADGKKTTDYEGVSIPSSGSGALVLPTLNASVDNSAWAWSRVITLTPTPSNAKVTCIGKPAGASTAQSGNKFTVTRNGLYTFSITSGGETAIAMATVSKVDFTGPTVTFDTLDNSRTYVEPVTLTVRAADSESGFSSLSGFWEKAGSPSETAAFTKVSNGVYTTTSPNKTGTWTLTVTAEDKVRNKSTAGSAAYNLNLNVPTVTVTKGSTNANGSVNYTYSVNMNGQTVQTVQLPDGTLTTALSGSFTLTEAGTYYVVVTDTAGHLARSAAMTVTNSGSNPVDGQPPEVRLRQSTEEWVNATTGVTITVNAYDNIAPTSATWKLGSGAAQSITLSTDTDAGVGSKAKTGSFKVTANGTYTVTAKDARSNTGTAEIEITNIDSAAPTITNPSGNPTAWTANNATISFNVTDTQSGVKTVTAKKGSANVTVSGSGPYRFTATANGDYVITVTDNVGNKATKTVSVTKIDKTTPTISVTGGTTAAASLNLTVNAANSGGSGVTTTVKKDGGAAQAVSGGKYTVTQAGTYVFTAKTGTGKTASKTVTIRSITFNAQGGSAVGSKLVANAGTFGTLPTTTRTGYTFRGWYTAATGGTKLTAATAVTANTTAYAQWALDAPTVELTADKTSATYTGSPVITLTATASHTADDLTYTYQWYQGNVLQSGKTGSTLPLTNVAESGTYKIKVTASDGTLTSTAESANKTVTISKSAPVLSDLSATAITYGDALTASTPSGKATDPETNANLSGSWSWTASDASTTYPTVVTDSSKTAYSVTFTPDNKNYDPATATVKLTVNKATLTPSVNTVADKVYDGSTSATGTVKLTGVKFSQTPEAKGTFTFNSANVTEANAVDVTAIALTGDWGGNYVLSGTSLSGVSTTARITPKPVSLTWAGDQGLVYNGSPVNVTATAGSLVGSDVCTVTVEGGRETNAGTHTATATALSNTNYKLPAVVTKAYTIAKATPALSALSATAITYGDALSASTPDGTANHPTTDADVDGTWSWTVSDASTTYPTVVTDSDTTEYSVTFVPTDTTNYNANTATVTLTVNQATLTPSVNTVADKVYDGGTDTTGTVALAGAKFTDAPEAEGTFTFNSANVTEANAVDVADIALTGDWGGNYVLSGTSLSGVSTTARITPKPVTLTWNGTDGLVYNGSPVNVTATAGSLVGEDVCTVTVDDGGRAIDAGSHTATATALSNTNYKLPEVVTRNYTIAKATPALSALSATAITYGDALTASTPDGTAQHPTTSAAVPGTWTWTAADAGSTYPTVVTDSGKTAYTVTFTPDDDTNYNANTATVTLTVNKATLTPSVNTVADKVYDGGTGTTGTVALAGAKFTDAPEAAGTFNFNSANVNDANAVNVSAIALTDDWGGNYVLSTETLSAIPTTARIAQKEVTLTWNGDQGLVYDRLPVNVTATAGALAEGDACAVTVDNGTQTNAGTYTATAVSLDNPNYKLPQAVTRGYTIAKCPVTFTVSHNDVDYHHGGHPKADVTAPGLTKDTEFTVSYRQTGEVIEPHFSGTYDIMVQLTDDNFKFEGQDDDCRELKVGDLTINHVSYEGTITWPTASNAITYGQPLSEVKFAGGSGSTEGGEGTFAWDAPDSFPDVATTKAVMVFDPEDPEYDNVEYDVAIQVNKAILTPSVDTAADKVFDGSAATTGTLKLAGAQFGEAPTAVGTFDFVDKNVAESKAVNVTAIALTDSWNANYVLSTEALSAIPTAAKITPKAVTLTWDGYRDLVYNGKPVNVTATAGDLVEGDTCAVTVDDEGRATDARPHTATATALSNPNYQLPQVVTWDYTIAPKPITLLWHNMIQPYNGADQTPKAVTDVEAANGASAVTLQGVVPEDDGTAGVVFTVTQNGKSAQAINAETYMVSGAMRDGSNYVVTGYSSAQLTVQKAPVTFTVTDNAIKEGEPYRAPTITTDPAGVPFTVVYKDRDGEVVDPQIQDLKTGAYTIWVAITDDDNYHHVGSATGGAAQIGVFTVYAQDPPPKYAVTFEAADPEDEPGADGGVVGVLSGSTETLAATEADTLRVLPQCAFTCTGYAFAGWELDGQIYPAGATYTQEARDVTFTAQWVKAVHTVEGVVDQDGKPVNHVQVTLMLGSNVIAQQHTDAAGKFRFENIAPGLYNLVVTKDGVTMTVEATIVDQDEARNITLPTHKTNSVVVVAPGTPNVVVGNLENNFTPEDKDLATKDVSTEVEYKFTVQQEPEDESSADQQAIQETAGRATPGLYLELTLEKTVTQGDTVTTAAMPESNVLIESVIPLPAELQGKYRYSVIRCHGEGADAQVEELEEEVPNDAGEYFVVNDDQTVLTIYARKFSTYAVAYSDRHSGGLANLPTVMPTEHGKVSLQPNLPGTGDKVTVTPKPDEGYELDHILIQDKDGNTVPHTENADGTLTFTQPDGAVTVTPVFRPVGNLCDRDASCPAYRFADLDLNAWYHDGIHFCVERELMVGTSKTTFAPSMDTSRAMIATILWRLQGSKTATGSIPYPDVPGNAWYTEAVRWATSEGIVTGYDTGKFGPNDPITREQLATMLYRCEQKFGSGGFTGSWMFLLDFADAAQVSEWAYEAMCWMTMHKVITGKGDKVLDPQGQATRAEAATMLQRFIQLDK